MKLKIAAVLVAATVCRLASADAGDPFKPVSAEVDARYHAIYKDCLEPAFNTTTCIYKPNETPLRQIPVLSTFVSDAGLVLVDATHTLKEAAWAISLAAYRRQTLYSKERAIGLNFDALLDELDHKARQEGLKSCQRACLATCVSSRIIDYDERNTKAPVKQAYAAVETEKGVCREFSEIARSLMRRLGLSATLSGGTDEELSADGTYEGNGGHVMVSVELDGKQYLMEPQWSSCNFYNPKFSRTRKPGNPRIVLENTAAPQPSTPPAPVTSSWSKKMDVMTSATVEIHKLQRWIAPARSVE